jgi:rhodanese-related sulfurtransferase
MMNQERPAPVGSGIKAPESIRPLELMRQLREGTAPVILDVREAPAFGAGHLPGSLHAPDSQTTALVKKLQTVPRAILVCDNGTLSSMVRRTLGFCGFHAVSYLEGGLKAWVAAGGPLMEITRSGGERALDLLDESEAALPAVPAPSPWRRMVAALGVR